MIKFKYKIGDWIDSNNFWGMRFLLKLISFDIESNCGKFNYYKLNDDGTINYNFNMASYTENKLNRYNDKEFKKVNPLIYFL
jgi:hypothetical protein